MEPLCICNVVSSPSTFNGTASQGVAVCLCSLDPASYPEEASKGRIRSMIPAERRSEQWAKASGALDESRLSAQNLVATSLGS